MKKWAKFPFQTLPMPILETCFREYTFHNTDLFESDASTAIKLQTHVPDYQI